MSRRDIAEVRQNPSLRMLSFVLRNKELWPTGFAWFYGNCKTCAMGLAARLWPAVVNGRLNIDTGPALMSKAFGMPVSIARLIFVHQHFCIGPETVAECIDRYLASEKHNEQSNRDASQPVNAELCSTE